MLRGRVEGLNSRDGDRQVGFAVCCRRGQRADPVWWWPWSCRSSRSHWGSESQERAQRAGAESWGQWWAELAREPGLEAEFAERARLWPAGAFDRKAVGLTFHAEALREAGFAEVAVVWQDLAERVLMAVR